MNTANLRLKFVPFIKKDTKDSLCSLEIVPQVSCIENLHEITLQDNNDQIEYTVPVTYRITITKPSEILKEEEKKVSRKAYYSCVDLPMSSELESGKGDVTRHISENLIFEQVHSSEYDVFIKEIRKIFADYRKHMFQHQKKQKALPPVLSKAIGDVKSDKSTITINKETSRDTLKRIYCRDMVCATDDDNSAVWSDNKKLTITPICLIAAKDSMADSIEFQYLTHQSSFDPSQYSPFSRSPENERDYPNCLACMKYRRDFSENTEVSTKENEDRSLYSRTPYAYYADKSNTSARIKIQTQIKIAELRNELEQAMLPLKIKFNEIVKNCKVKGIKYAGDGKDLIPIKKSNRVIYSIVFDEK